MSEIVRSRRNCCVVGCSSTESKNPELHFYRFPGKKYEVERKESWIKSINRQTENGNLWRPTAESRVCSEHFVGGKKSDIMQDVAYIPTIFPYTRQRELEEQEDVKPDMSTFTLMSNNLKTESEIKTESIYTENYDSFNTCRLCLNQNNELLSIFEKTFIETEEMLFSQMAVECASIQIAESDKLPKGICPQCVENLNQAYKFRRLCENSERNFYTFLNRFDNNLINEQIKIECPSDDEHSIKEDMEIVKNELMSPELSSDNFENNSSEDAKDLVNVNVEEGVETQGLQCKFCTQSLPDEDTLNSHHEIHEKILENVCKICNLNFSNLSFLCSHMKKIHNDTNPYSCMICPKNFTSITSLKNHLKIHTGENKIGSGKRKTRSCNICGKVLSCRSSLSKHMKIHNGQKDFVCQICNKGFILLEQLKIHEKRHAGEKSHFCKICGKGFYLKHPLMEHERTHTGKKHYICKECGKGYNYAHLLKEHEESHKGVKRYVCKECGKGFSCTSYLKNHMKIHSDDKVYTCKGCGLTFPANSELKLHIETHIGEKPHVCMDCGMGFSKPSYLTKHRRVHTLEKPYVCHVCLKAFSHNAPYKAHVKRHTSEPDQICSYCNKAFYEKSELQKHIRIHTGERPFSCQICNKSFTQYSSLLKHKTTHE